MSDFTSNFWSLFVAGITLAGIFGCALLLWITASNKDAPTADNTTGHVWDEDLTEMNNPMPRWWMWLFVITIVFGLGTLRLILVSAHLPASWAGRSCPSTRQKWLRPTPSSSPCMRASTP